MRLRVLWVLGGLLALLSLVVALWACDRPRPTAVPPPAVLSTPENRRATPTLGPGPVESPTLTPVQSTLTDTAAAPVHPTLSCTATASPTTVAVQTESPLPRSTGVSPTPDPRPSPRECIVARARYYANTVTHYRAGNTGPQYFDCTGFVYRVFADCELTELIGVAGEQAVSDYYQWFVARGQADALPPKLGDLIVYGPDWAHVAIYVGDGRAISALMDGIREHDAVHLRSGSAGEMMPVRAYLHLQF